MAVVGCIDLGNLTNFLFFFGNGSVDANWQGASKGFVGDVAVNGLVASERTSGFVPYAGTIFTNAPTLGAWQNIINANPGQAFGSTSQVALINQLETDKQNAFAQINALTPTPGFASVSASSLNGVDFSSNPSNCIVINVTSGFSGISSKITISGRADQAIVLRWDSDGNPLNGYQGQVKFQSGGAIVPGGGLKPTNFINVAGDINSSGGGTNPPPPYPQGPRFNDGQGALITGGQDFNGGGFFTGYWLTTGDPVTGQTSSLSNGIFVGGWYTNTTKFSMTSGTSGVFVSPPVAPEADIFVEKTAGCYVAGQPLTYTLQVGNLGPATAENVVLTDAIPATLSGVQFSTDGGLTFNPWTGSLTLGTLAAGASVTILIRGTVNPSATGPITNTATVSSTTPDPNPANNTSTVTVNPCVTPSADIFVVKTAANCYVAGQLLTYTLQVGNLGPNAAGNVVLTDAIPATLSGVQFSTDGGLTFNPWTGSLTLGTLAAGASVTILIRGTVNPSATGPITNTATVSSTTPDANPANNTSTVTVNPCDADIFVVKTAANCYVAGQLFTYTLQVGNLGPDTAENVVLTDAIPATLSGVQFSTDGGLTFNPWTGSLTFGTLAAGFSVTILIRGTVNPSATGPITNTATVSSTTPDPNPANNTSTVTVNPCVTPSADIFVVKTAENCYVAGQLLTYTLQVGNLGPDAADNVVLTDAIPATLSGVQFSIDGGFTFNPWPGSFTFGTLAAGASVTILIRGTVNPSATGPIANTATISSTTPDPNPANNTSTVTVNPCDADIFVVKTAENCYVAGQLFTYTLQVGNLGPDTADDVVLTDAIPATLSGVQFSTDGGFIFDPWTGSLTLGTLAAGASITIIIRGTVNPSATGPITNTATVNSTTPDPNPANNTSTVTVNPCVTPCNATVSETVCVQASVTITPAVTVGAIETFCVGVPTIGACPGSPVQACAFTVSQNVCVQIPLTFAATAVAIPAGIVCGTPTTGPCT